MPPPGAFVDAQTSQGDARFRQYSAFIGSKTCTPGELHMDRSDVSSQHSTPSNSTLLTGYPDGAVHIPHPTLAPTSSLDVQDTSSAASSYIVSPTTRDQSQGTPSSFTSNAPTISPHNVQSPPPPRVSAQSTFACRYNGRRCDHQFPRLDQLVAHEKEMHKLPCEQGCDLTAFRSPKDRQRHYVGQHGHQGANYHCGHCGYGTTSRYNYDRHVRALRHS